MSDKIIGINCPYEGAVVEIPQPTKQTYEIGDKIVFSYGDAKEEFGVVCHTDHEKEKNDKLYFKNGLVLRKVTANDIQKIENNVERGKAASEFCKKEISTMELNMQLFRTFYSFDGTKINFIFTSEGRVDFRELVKKLARKFNKQIHLQQIGPRDKAKLVSGFGRCGQRLCCNKFLNKFESISMDMVREQNMANKGSAKLSGCCGKLLCCLQYEVDLYKALRENIPPLGSKVLTKEDQGSVIGIDVLNQKVKIIVDDKDTKIIDVKDIKKVEKAKESDKEQAAEMEDEYLTT